MVSPWMQNGSLTTYLNKNFTELTIERKFQIVSHSSTKKNTRLIHQNLSYSKSLQPSATVRVIFTCLLA